MFFQIFFFEFKYRLRRPGIYIYFLFCFGMAFLNFGLGALPIDEKQFVNSPASIAFYMSMMSMVLMLASSAIMGVPLYRDIEYNTRAYYLSYPITPAGYFWGRYLASFLLVLLLAVGLLLGAWLGSVAGPLFGWQEASLYGPNKFIYYLHPFLTLALPNLFFSSSLFFGLVAVLRNVKVIYSSGILLFMGYLISNFFINSSSSSYVTFLADPFAINGVKFIQQSLSVPEKNSQLLRVDGLMLANRLLWTGIGAAVLLTTWLRFSFERFFGPGREKKTDRQELKSSTTLPEIHVEFRKRYNWPVLFTLTRIEVLNIIRDNYFWIIIGAGSIFLGIIFSHGYTNFGVRDYPRTSMILFMFNNNFLIFIFCVIIFYTGEVIHRERATGYSFINDALPPPVWVFYLSKILSICCLALFLTIMPMLIGMIAQISRGYYLFNFPVYFKVLFLAVLPKLLEMMMLSFLLHICIRNKFAALGVGIAYTVLCVLAIESGYMNYRLLLYSFTPFYAISDFDNLGHMLKPITWFNIYWLLLGLILLTGGYLFYIRGSISSLKERMQLAKERFKGRTLFLTAILAVCFILTACFNYYNVSVLNPYYSEYEKTLHMVSVEKTLKRYEDMPLPKITDVKMFADIFPEKQEVFFKSFVTVKNKMSVPITQFLLDGDNLTDFSLKYNHELLSYTCPLFYPRGKFNFLRPRQDSSGYRLYQLPRMLQPGDSALLEINSSRFFKGFTNDLFGANTLYNGVVMGVGLPGFGYDDDEEIRNEDDRKKYGLPKRDPEFPAEKEADGRNMLSSGRLYDLFTYDITISTSSDQTGIGSGNLEKQWKENGRNYYRFTGKSPGMYTAPGILSARYANLHDSVLLDGKGFVSIDLYYHPTHNTNLQRFVAAYKDGLRYYSKAFGPYPFRQTRLAESSVYAPTTSSMAATDIYTERYGWNADFQNPDQVDYCYYTTAKQLAKQWWGNEVSANNTRGAKLILEGLPKYCALMLFEKKYGVNNMRAVLQEELQWYLWQARWYKSNLHPLSGATYGTEIDNKAGVVLYGLKDLIGEDSMNAALHEFRNAFAFRTAPPFAGTSDLYACLKKHTPDSLLYYLTDAWEKVSFYDNRIVEAKAIPTNNSRQYKVSITFNTSKIYVDENGNDKAADTMNDYIDIGIFAADTKNKEGRTETRPLYIKKHRLTAGEHTIEIIVPEKPVRAGIDPYQKLIDRIPGDNNKNL